MDPERFGRVRKQKVETVKNVQKKNIGGEGKGRVTGAHKERVEEEAGPEGTCLRSDRRKKTVSELNESRIKENAKRDCKRRRITISMQKEERNTTEEERKHAREQSFFYQRKKRFKLVRNQNKRKNPALIDIQ